MSIIFLVLLISLACGSPVHKPVSRLQFGSKNVTSRIVGGLPSYPDQYPFMALLSTFKFDGLFYYCGATILNEFWVLTAAQCVNDADLFWINVGSVYLTQDDDQRQVTYGSNFLAHPDHDPTTFKNDIAVLQSFEPFLFTHYVAPIGSLPREDAGDYRDGIALGWGQVNDFNTEFSEVLINAPLYTISLGQCQAAYGVYIVTEDIICLEGERGEGACFGDTGGPFVVYQGPQSIVFGVSSFVSARGCENPDPSGYTKVYPFVNWIESVINSE